MESTFPFTSRAAGRTHGNRADIRQGELLAPSLRVPLFTFVPPL